MCNGIQTRECDGPDVLQYEKEVIEVGHRWEPGESISVPLSVLLITPEIGWVGLPGEPFSQLQKDLRRQSPVKSLFVTGYTDQSVGYLPPLAAALEGGYGANDRSTRVAVGTSERLVTEALVTLHRLCGNLDDTPGKSATGYR